MQRVYFNFGLRWVGFMVIWIPTLIHENFWRPQFHARNDHDNAAPEYSPVVIFIELRESPELGTFLAQPEEPQNILPKVTEIFASRYHHLKISTTFRMNQTVDKMIKAGKN